MKNGTKKLLNYLLIIGTLAIVLVIGFNGQDFYSAIHALTSIPLKWVVMLVLAWLLYLSFDALSVWYFLRRQGQRISIHYALYIAITGIYYCNITPGATGGQPMQAFYLHKAGVPYGVGSSALVVKFFFFQFMLTVLGTIFWILNVDFVARQVEGQMWILVVGYVYNCASVTLLLVVCINRRAVAALIRWVVKLGTKLHLVKDPEKSMFRANAAVDAFHSSILMLKEHKSDILMQALFGGLELMAQMMVIVCVYKAFQLQGSTLSQMIAMGLLQYTSASYTPLPGASGAQEGVFALYFDQIFPEDVCFLALLLWRFFTYYLSLIVGAIVVVFRGIHPWKFPAKEDQPADTELDAEITEN